jgi:hypothetical protein
MKRVERYALKSEMRKDRERERERIFNNFMYRTGKNCNP